MRRSHRLPLEELAPYLLQLPDPPALLDWRQVFGDARPVELEVGFAKGLFLLTASRACPDVNFVGVEILRKFQLFVATRLAKRQRRNVRVGCADAREFLRDRVATASMQAIHVYFPDPWWKKRHHKRRLFTPAFAAECGRVLAPSGRLHVVTDVEDYYHTINDLLAARPELHPQPPPEATTPRHDLDYLTNFERKFRKQGKPIWRSAYVKAEVPFV